MVFVRDPSVLKDEPFHALSQHAVPKSWRVIQGGMRAWQSRHRWQNKTAQAYAESLNEWNAEKERFANQSYPKFANFVRRVGAGQTSCRADLDTLEAS